MDGRLTAPEDPVAVVGRAHTASAFTGVGRRGKYLLFEPRLRPHARRPPADDRAGFTIAPGRERSRRTSAPCFGSTTARRSSTPTSAGSAHGASSLPASSRRTCGRGRGRSRSRTEWTPRRFRGDLAGRRASVKALLLHQGSWRGRRQHLRRRGALAGAHPSAPSGRGADGGRGAAAARRRGRDRWSAGSPRRAPASATTAAPTASPARCRSASTPTTATASRARAAARPSRRSASPREEPTYARGAPDCPEGRRPASRRRPRRRRPGARRVDPHGRGGRGRRRLRARPDREVARVRRRLGARCSCCVRATAASTRRSWATTCAGQRPTRCARRRGLRSAACRRSATTLRSGRWSTSRCAGSRPSGARPARRGRCSRSSTERLIEAIPDADVRAVNE